MKPDINGRTALLWATGSIRKSANGYICDEYTAHYDTAFNEGCETVELLRDNLFSMIRNRDKMVSDGREILCLVLGYYSASHNDEFLTYIAPCIGLAWRNQDLNTLKLLLQSTYQKEAYNVVPFQVYSASWLKTLS